MNMGEPYDVDFVESEAAEAVHRILEEVKAQGMFDEVRKVCMSDVDTKPAYQNLEKWVEGSSTDYLSCITWRPELSKNKTRDSVRKTINEMPVFESGIERIVDQVISPKIRSSLLPPVSDRVYDLLGLAKQHNKGHQHFYLNEESVMSGVKNSIQDLLPNDLDPISPSDDGAEFGEDESLTMEEGSSLHETKSDSSKCTSKQNEQNILSPSSEPSEAIIELPAENTLADLEDVSAESSYSMLSPSPALKRKDPEVAPNTCSTEEAEAIANASHCLQIPSTFLTTCPKVCSEAKTKPLMEKFNKIVDSVLLKQEEERKKNEDVKKNDEKKKESNDEKKKESDIKKKETERKKEDKSERSDKHEKSRDKDHKKDRDRKTSGSKDRKTSESSKSRDNKERVHKSSSHHHSVGHSKGDDRNKEGKSEKESSRSHGSSSKDHSHHLHKREDEKNSGKKRDEKSSSSKYKDDKLKYDKSSKSHHYKSKDKPNFDHHKSDSVKKSDPKLSDKDSNKDKPKSSDGKGRSSSHSSSTSSSHRQDRKETTSKSNKSNEKSKQHGHSSSSTKAHDADSSKSSKHGHKHSDSHKAEINDTHVKTHLKSDSKNNAATPCPNKEITKIEATVPTLTKHDDEDIIEVIYESVQQKHSSSSTKAHDADSSKIYKHGHKHSDSHKAEISDKRVKTHLKSDNKNNAATPCPNKEITKLEATVPTLTKHDDEDILEVIYESVQQKHSSLTPKAHKADKLKCVNHDDKQTRSHELEFQETSEKIVKTHPKSDNKNNTSTPCPNKEITKIEATIPTSTKRKSDEDIKWIDVSNPQFLSKKPKIAANMYEVKKIIKLRKNFEQLEEKRNKLKAEEVRLEEENKKKEKEKKKKKLMNEEKEMIEQKSAKRQIIEVADLHPQAMEVSNSVYEIVPPNVWTENSTKTNKKKENEYASWLPVLNLNDMLKKWEDFDNMSCTSIDSVGSSELGDITDNGCVISFTEEEWTEAKKSCPDLIPNYTSTSTEQRSNIISTHKLASESSKPSPDSFCGQILDRSDNMGSAERVAVKPAIYPEKKKLLDDVLPDKVPALHPRTLSSARKRRASYENSHQQNPEKRFLLPPSPAESAAGTDKSERRKDLFDIEEELEKDKEKSACDGETGQTGLIDCLIPTPPTDTHLTDITEEAAATAVLQPPLVHKSKDDVKTAQKLVNKTTPGRGRGKRVQGSRRSNITLQRYDSSDLYKPRPTFTPTRRLREYAANNIVTEEASKKKVTNK